MNQYYFFITTTTTTTIISNIISISCASPNRKTNFSTSTEITTSRIDSDIGTALMNLTDLYTTTTTTTTTSTTATISATFCLDKQRDKRTRKEISKGSRRDRKRRNLIHCLSERRRRRNQVMNEEFAKVGNINLDFRYMLYYNFVLNLSKFIFCISFS